MKQTHLVIAPHCDDEVLGCGGTIAKKTAQGHQVHVCIVTNGHLGAPELFPEEGTKKVRSEALEAHKLLGVSSTHFLDFPCPRLDTIPSYTLSLAIEKLIRKLCITDLYLPHPGDLHKDHGITFEAALVSARPVNNCPVKRISTYETVSETEWAPPFAGLTFTPTIFEDITDHLELKVKAFELFQTQIKSFPHPRSAENLRYLARLRGSSAGIGAAEAFMSVRRVED